MKARTRWYVFILALLVIGVVEGLWLLSTTPASYGYSVEAQFSSLPANDEALAGWLKARPGVVARSVHVERGGEDGKVLRVKFIQSRGLWGRPATQGLDQACRELGYGGVVEGFHDAER
ncbi:MAG TPA: hypothetical protein VHQ47_13725 [Phycisphaerae bacterium]|nr:hypothetical protein [Phycisphaerae bacterium]